MLSVSELIKKFIKNCGYSYEVESAELLQKYSLNKCNKYQLFELIFVKVISNHMFMHLYFMYKH